MLLPIFVLSIATIMLVMAYQNTKKNDTTTKVFLVFCYLLVLAICIKYGVINNKQLLEGFEVQIPDMDDDMDSDMNNGETSQSSTGVKGASLQDLENKSNMGSSLENLKEQVNNKKSSTNEKFDDIIQKDSEGTHSVFKPQIIINTNDGSQAEDLSMYMPNAKVFVPKMDEKTTTTSGETTTTSGETTTTSGETMKDIVMTPGRRNGLLNGKNTSDDLFGNGSISQPETSNIQNVNSGASEDAFHWISTYKQRQTGGDNSKQYTQERFGDDDATTTTASHIGNRCSDYVSRPYVEETRSMIDPSTLTNNSYVPGMQYMPPSNWRQPNNTITLDSRVGNTGYRMNTRTLPIGMMDYGTPVNALEIGSDGTIAKTEEEVHLTNVGSIMPKFEYREYIDHYSIPSSGTTTTTQAATTTTIPGSML